MDTLQHRKTVRHYDEPGQVHELTFSCFARKPLLLDEYRCRMLSQSIDNATGKQGFDLLAFVFMPEHVHLLVAPILASAQIANLLFAIKRPFSYRVKKLLEATNVALLSHLMIRERPGKVTFRFWQEGPGYDRNLLTPAAVISAIDYLHNNPVKRGLCLRASDWKWSSWMAYHSPEFAQPELPLVKRFVV